MSCQDIWSDCETAGNGMPSCILELVQTPLEDCRRWTILKLLHGPSWALVHLHLPGASRKESEAYRTFLAMCGRDDDGRNPEWLDEVEPGDALADMALRLRSVYDSLIDDALWTLATWQDPCMAKDTLNTGKEDTCCSSD